MPDRRPRRPWVFALRFALVMGAVASIVPYWLGPGGHGWCGYRPSVTFWGMVWSSAKDLASPYSPYWLGDYGSQYAAMLSILGVSFWIGLGIGWLRNRRAADPSDDGTQSAPFLNGAPRCPRSG